MTLKTVMDGSKTGPRIMHLSGASALRVGQEWNDKKGEVDVTILQQLGMSVNPSGHSTHGPPSAWHGLWMAVSDLSSNALCWVFSEIPI